MTLRIPGGRTLNLSRRRLLAAVSLAALVPLDFAAAQAGPQDAAFAKASKDWLEGYLKLSPVFATVIGDHRYDAELDDVSAAGRAARIRFNKDVLRALEAIPRSGLSRASQVDAAILDNQVRGQIWTDEVLQEP